MAGSFIQELKRRNVFLIERLREAIDDGWYGDWQYFISGRNLDSLRELDLRDKRGVNQ